MRFDPRSERILHCAVVAYLETGKEVSSAAVVGRLEGSKPSAATVRNVMAQLEKQGFLAKPHSSAGRIPTESGLRHYLNHGLAPKLRPWDRTRLEASAQGTNPDRLPTQLSHDLAGLAGQMVVLAVPLVHGQVREVGFVRCAPGRFLAYFVLGGGSVHQKLVEVEFDLTSPELERLQGYLNHQLRKHDLEEVRRQLRAQVEAAAHGPELGPEALQVGMQALPEPEVKLVVEGASHLANKPEFGNQEKLHALLKAVEERKLLLQFLDRLLSGDGVQVILSSEMNVPEMGDLACVGVTGLTAKGERSATITVLGPARMDYRRLLPLVGCASDVFGRYWQPH